MLAPEYMNRAILVLLLTCICSGSVVQENVVPDFSIEVLLGAEEEPDVADICAI
jgi:hypothetical protein